MEICLSSYALHVDLAVAVSVVAPRALRLSRVVAAALHPGRLKAQFRRGVHKTQRQVHLYTCVDKNICA